MKGDGQVGKGNWDELQTWVSDFAVHEGRQPRIMASAPITGEEDPRIDEIAVLLANLGFNVDVGPFFRKEQELVSNAVENDVDILLLTGIGPKERTFFTRATEELLAGLKRSDMVLLLLEEGWEPPELKARLQEALEQLLGP